MDISASIYSPGLWSHTKEDENAALAPMYLCDLFEKTHRVNNLNSNGNERGTKCQLSGICHGCSRGHSKPVRQGSDLGLKDQAVISERKTNEDSRGCRAKTARRVHGTVISKPRLGRRLWLEWNRLGQGGR